MNKILIMLAIWIVIGILYSVLHYGSIKDINRFSVFLWPYHIYINNFSRDCCGVYINQEEENRVLQEYDTIVQFELNKSIYYPGFDVELINVKKERPFIQYYDGVKLPDDYIHTFLIKSSNGLNQYEIALRTESEEFMIGEITFVINTGYWEQKNIRLNEEKNEVVVSRKR